MILFIILLAIITFFLIGQFIYDLWWKLDMQKHKSEILEYEWIFHDLFIRGSGSCKKLIDTYGEDAVDMMFNLKYIRHPEHDLDGDSYLITKKYLHHHDAFYIGIWHRH